MNTIDNDGDTALIAAVNSEHLEAVKFLIDKGAEVHTKAMNGDTALERAKERGYEEIAKFLKAHGAKNEVCQVCDQKRYRNELQFNEANAAALSWRAR